ncbi:MAG: SdrD B-like domain-containing protein [Thiolinea sp.]
MQRHIPSYLWNSLIFFILSVNTAYADISGKVFRDFNASGVFDSSADFQETGMEGITVKAFAPDDTFDQPSATAVTDAAGAYTLSNLTADTQYRLEFSNLPEGYEPGVMGQGSGSSVQFVTDGATDADFAANMPCDYCQDNPDLASTRMTSDDFIGYAATPALVSFSSTSISDAAQPYVLGSNIGQNQFAKVTPMSTLTTLAQQADVGNTYGLAWHRESRTLFSAAFGRANTMTNGGLGSGGLGAIYQTRNGTTSLFATIADVGTFGNGDGNKTGMVGLGELQISADGKTLYAVNVFAHTLVSIPLNSNPPTAGVQTSTALPVPATCPAGNLHAFALGRNGSKLYVGMTCDGIGTADLRGYVYEYDGNQFTAKLDIPFNYPRPDLNANYHGQLTAYYNNDMNFIDWGTYPIITSSFSSNTAKSQPWLVDIEFDRGDMLLGVRSRLGDARLNAFWVTGGDILRACADSATNPTAWMLENNGSCGSTTLTAPTTTDPYTGRSLDSTHNSPVAGIGGQAYYWGNIGWEGKPSQGALAQIPGSTSFLATGVDIRSHLNEQGIMMLSHDSGAITAGGNIFYSNDAYADDIAKGNALGDLALLCDPAPVEVGNRVWLDDDRDGIQDAGESGIDGVEVQLVCGADTASVTTTAGGRFLFSNAAGGNAAFMDAGESCSIQVDTSQLPLNQYELTVADADSQTDNDSATDLRDSDATDNAGRAEITFTVGNSGENNHSLDIGFQTLMVDLSLDKTVNNPSATRGGEVIYTLTVTNDGPGDATGISVVDKLPAGVSWVSDDSASAYNPVTGIWAVGSLALGESRSLNITVKVK